MRVMMRNKLFVGLLLSFSLVFVAVVVLKSSGDEIVYLRPTINDPVNLPPQQWSVNPSGVPHYTAIDDEVINPAAADTNDYIFVKGTGKNGKEKEVFDMTSIGNVGVASKIQIWLYAKTTTCKGGGATACDRIALSAQVRGFLLDSLELTPTTGGFTWVGVTINNLQLLQQDIDKLRIVLDRVAQGTGNSNNDEIKVAAIYVAITHDAAEVGGGGPTDVQNSQVTVVSGAPVIGGFKSGFPADINYIEATTTTGGSEGGGEPSP